MIPFPSSIGEQGKSRLSSFVGAGPFADRGGPACGPPPPLPLLPCVFLQELQEIVSEPEQRSSANSPQGFQSTIAIATQ
jgi:hypothetical protein